MNYDKKTKLKGYDYIEPIHIWIHYMGMNYLGLNDKGNSSFDDYISVTQWDGIKSSLYKLIRDKWLGNKKTRDELSPNNFAPRQNMSRQKVDLKFSSSQNRFSAEVFLWFNNNVGCAIYLESMYIHKLGTLLLPWNSIF